LSRQNEYKAEPFPGTPFLDPFGGAKPHLLRLSKEVTLRVNSEPFGSSHALEFVERQDQAFRLGCQRVDFS